MNTGLTCKILINIYKIYCKLFLTLSILEIKQITQIINTNNLTISVKQMSLLESCFEMLSKLKMLCFTFLINPWKSKIIIHL
ncbi:hypothetical protein BpHYR1_045764 [Brachionus plicatilis]|uniref:Uncharacterized protein n=1 Tax=Brachionus plicatilis TaxID=10195 RepID=A0A3M7RD96_BRAPC|nr:hypothetical protein BpHYR1_045764 [Brachionus plicatilis]